VAQGSPEVTAKGVIRRLVDRGFLLSVLALIVVLTGWSFLPENLRSLAAISIPTGMIAWLVYLSVAFFSLEILMTRSPGEQIWSRLAAWIALATLGVLAVIVLVGSLFAVFAVPIFFRVRERSPVRARFRMIDAIRSWTHRMPEMTQARRYVKPTASHRPL